ncbi:NAD(P)H-dependent oxidoreductase [Frondihabitans australicus]|uniref:Kef-type potassium/proton antiporter accessory protein (CPA2 family) n=1 Tax=Frondihabitans australicus TaxID=386892 RepID=A0A495IK41_9MICO|nr:NAD(P)H-dependent oxidoreductase [Frondihabitans australicus]RKR76337.1 Kef-type potassium/proton antiporter accessory protein (CPA2 family) [Frondihabitans australicus]
MSTLIILAHPNKEAARINASLAEPLLEKGDVTLHDLYAEYPDHIIDAKLEQRLLLEHTHIVLQFPLHWYSVPGLLKDWMDRVLERGWAYGDDGGPGFLRGKSLQVAVSTSEDAREYEPGRPQYFTIDQFLVPLKATALRLGMTWETPIVVDNVLEDGSGLRNHVGTYIDGVGAGRR